MDVVLQVLIHAIVAGAVYALIASGLSFIYATTRVFHLAHGGVITISAYVFWYVAKVLLWHPILAGVLALLVSVLVGYLMNEFVYERLRAKQAKGLGYLIATIALLMLCGAFVIAVFGAQTQTFSLQTEVYRFAGAHITFLQLIIVFVSGGILGGLAAIMKFTRFGKAMRATADNETVAQVLGIHTKTIRRNAFLVGSLLGGVAAILIALEFNLDPNMGVMFAIKGFTAMVAGGAGSMIGAVTGSLLLGGVEQIAVWFYGAGWKNAISFVLLVLFLLVRPTGLFGRKTFQ